MSWSDAHPEHYGRLESYGEALLSASGWAGLVVDWDFVPLNPAKEETT